MLHLICVAVLNRQHVVIKTNESGSDKSWAGTRCLTPDSSFPPQLRVSELIRDTITENMKHT